MHSVKFVVVFRHGCCAMATRVAVLKASSILICATLVLDMPKRECSGLHQAPSGDVPPQDSLAFAAPTAHEGPGRARGGARAGGARGPARTKTSKCPPDANVALDLFRLLYVPPAGHAKCPRAAAKMRGTADGGGWDGDDSSVFGTRLGVGGVARRTQR